MCILFVEDEALIRLLMTDELTEAGFQVCNAEDGDRAADIIRDPPIRLSLLITDIHMPGRMDGIAVGRLMREADPAVPIIFTTGRIDLFPTMPRLTRWEALLAKPYAPSDLLKVARRLTGKAA